MNSKKNDKIKAKYQGSKEELKQSSTNTESYQIAATQNMRIPHLENYDHIRD